MRTYWGYTATDAECNHDSACLGQPSPQLLEYLVPKPESCPGPLIPGVPILCAG